MDKKLEMEIERITSALKYSDYCSLNEFLERLKGYEKLTEHRFKLGEYKVIRRVRNEREKALMFRKFTLQCDQNILKGCTASIELGRNGDVLKVFKFDDYHNHDSIKNKDFYCYKRDSARKSDSCENGYVRKIFAYPSARRKLIYDRCPVKCCKSHYLGLERGKELFHIRRNLGHNHDRQDDDIDSDEDIEPRRIEENYKIYFQKALDIVGQGLMAKKEEDMRKALKEFMTILEKHGRRL
ncbi:unnamed protein product [Hymenolepis diminuta]|uniref:FAR1 domain-containing protein n=1 Tax=Hymenolepis diminuta TaxID=6216 RepID=A0A0R3SQ98_HYMDI|nr:unnamed protein product [Hymenolepis diminuta]VUZ38706.1 unnamed protein product [Hymenolepis diminuta]VUZ38719.1 unnamed protein product [Hymenolepis diminuta]